MRAALGLGVDIVGGIDPAGIDRDPMRHLEAVFDLAVRFDRGVDIHLHDPGDLGRWQIERICDLTRSSGRVGRVTISHAYCLGAVRARRPRCARRHARGAPHLDHDLRPAAHDGTAGAWLRSRGVNVCSGSDGIRDAWGPMGNGDMLERAMLIALRFGWSKDDDLAAAFDVVSAGGARALGIESYGIEAGRPANFVLVAAENLPEAVIDRSMERTVVSRGKIVARDGKFAGL